jgi:hypothetical protein
MESRITKHVDARSSIVTMLPLHVVFPVWPYIRQGWKGLPAKNALAYLTGSSATEEKKMFCNLVVSSTSAASTSMTFAVAAVTVAVGVCVRVCVRQSLVLVFPSWFECKVRVDGFVTKLFCESGTVFTTLNCLHNLDMRPIS